jgi:5'-nucleotidase
MRILISNDDGINAPGIHALKTALDTLGEVFLVAPERPRSASGHSITLHKPLRIEEVRLPDGSKAWSTNGTPSDCVTLGFDILMEGKADLVFSGINNGSNLGWDLTYSGTVAAAMEGCILGIPSAAISIAGTRGPYDYASAAQFARKLAELILNNGLTSGTLLNVNIPHVPHDKIRGVSVTHQGRRQYTDRIDTRVDPWGKPYYWVHGEVMDDGNDPESDVHNILENFISVTPVHLDLTAQNQMERIQAWNWNNFLACP